nr:SLATT domain-containing protein [Caviibacterium pharyngocola]
MDKLLNTMKITSKSRFNASTRIFFISKISFITTTILSLGLILIPMLSMIIKEETFSSQTLNIVQVFLAVSVLVYSTIIGTAKYEVRAKELDSCGVKIKNLIREIRAHRAKTNDDALMNELDKYTEKYNELVESCENHNRADYIYAQLDLSDIYTITGLHRMALFCKFIFLYIFPYIIPCILILLEVFFLSDLLGITQIFVNYLK